MADSLMRSVGLDSSNPEEAALPAKYYLFVIAVDDYPARPLNNPVKDAASIVNVLLKRYKFDVPPNGKDLRLTNPKYQDQKIFTEPIIEYDGLQTKCLYNENATRTNITKHLTAVREKIGPDDALLIYCAGHGEFNDVDKTYYFIPFGADMADPDTWYDVARFYKGYGDYPKDNVCRDLLVILDCCFAGRISLGNAKQVTDIISRKVLTSCLFDEPADDGQKFHGSTFAKALKFVLDDNKSPAAELDDAALNKKFRFYIEKDLRRQAIQKILYSPLPVDYGQREFIFQLRELDQTPPDLLAQTFIEHLNFEDQKTDFRKYFKGREKGDYIVVAMIGRNYNVHKLQTKVLFEWMKQLSKVDDLVFSTPIITNPDKLGTDIWDALRIYFNVAAGDEETVKTQCVQALCNSMLVDNQHTVYNQVLPLVYGCQFQNEGESARIGDFCKELLERVSETKQGPQYAGKSFKKLMLFIADTREGGTPFLKHDAMSKKIGPLSTVVVARPVSDLELGLAVTWHEEASEIINQSRFKTFPVQQYFDKKDSYDIESFILQVAQDLEVDPKTLCNNLWNYT